MFDFSLIQPNADNPSLTAVIYTMIFAFLLSVLIAFTYEKTSRNEITPGNFIQAMILSSIVAATVMQAIGDSLARGLGMLGALAIIRFRTTLREPRNIIFMFASLATGISCGVFGFNSAFVGTLMFCGVAFLLRLTPYSQPANQTATLRFQLNYIDENGETAVKNLLKSTCSHFHLVRMELVENKEQVKSFEHQYSLVLKKQVSEQTFLRQVDAIEGVSRVRFTLRNAEGELF